MRGLLLLLPAVMLTVVSCAGQEQTETVRRAMDQKSETEQVSVPFLVPPARELDDSLIVTERYSLPDGGTMEDRVRMVRRKQVICPEGRHHV